MFTEMNIDQAIYQRDAAFERTRAFTRGSRQWIEAITSLQLWTARVLALLGVEAVAA